MKCSKGIHWTRKIDKLGNPSRKYIKVSQWKRRPFPATRRIHNWINPDFSLCSAPFLYGLGGKGVLWFKLVTCINAPCTWWGKRRHHKTDNPIVTSGSFSSLSRHNHTCHRHASTLICFDKRWSLDPNLNWDEKIMMEFLVRSLSACHVYQCYQKLPLLNILRVP